MDRIKNILGAKKIRPTFIRLKILEYLYSCREHPSAETIFTVLEKEIPTISRTSVYNTLSLFEEKDLITTHYIGGSVGRYDCHKESHFHFMCDECKKILDLDIDCNVLDECVIQGHTVRESFGYFKGLCRDCMENKAAVMMSHEAPDHSGDNNTNFNIKETKNV